VAKSTPRGSGLPGLWSLLDSLPCFFKLRHTAKVKTLLAQMRRAGGAWQDAGAGWEVIGARLRLSGWSAGWRVVLVREKPALAPSGAQARRRRATFAPVLPGADD
jgi:hypothetical protein